MAANPQGEAPQAQPPAPGPGPGPMTTGGSSFVLMVKILAAVFAVLILIWYLITLAYSDSPFWLFGIIIGAVGIGVGIAGIFIGNVKVFKKRNMPTLNIILIIVSIILLCAMPVLGSWEEPTIGKSLSDTGKMVFILIFSLFFLCYIELCHASLRFSEIDDYATSHNIKDFSVKSVISNYFLWFGILMTIITLFSAMVLLLQIFISPYIQDTAPQFGFSLEYNSIYNVLISIALIFIPIGIVITFIFGFFFKSRREIIVKGKEDVRARAPEAVKVK
jgi:hypothetical protein